MFASTFPVSRFIEKPVNVIKSQTNSALMKPSIAVLYILVSLCLAVSLVTFFIVAGDHGFFAPNNPAITPTPYASAPPVSYNPTPQTTNPPNQAPTISPESDLTFTYTYNGKEDLADGISRVSYTITAETQANTPVTIKYSDFHLQLTVWRMLIQMDAGTVTPQNSGTVTLNSSHMTESFELTFEFPTRSSNGMDQATNQFNLCYNGSAILIQK